MINRGWTPLILRIVRLFMMDCREGEKTRWHTIGATGLGPPPSRRLIREPGDLPCVPGASLFWDIGSAASTEVVMAQDEFSACRRPVSGFSDMLPILAIAWERA